MKSLVPLAIDWFLGPALVGFVLLAASGCSESSDPLTRAQASFRQSDWARATELCDEALQAQPENVEAWLLRGRILMQQDKPQEAVASFSRAIELHPHDPMSYRYRSNAYEAIHDLAAAEADRQKSREVDPDRSMWKSILESGQRPLLPPEDAASSDRDPSGDAAADPGLPPDDPSHHDSRARTLSRSDDSTRDNETSEPRTDRQTPLESDQQAEVRTNVFGIPIPTDQPALDLQAPWAAPGANPFDANQTADKPAKPDNKTPELDQPSANLWLPRAPAGAYPWQPNANSRPPIRTGYPYTQSAPTTDPQPPTTGGFQPTFDPRVPPSMRVPLSGNPFAFPGTQPGFEAQFPGSQFPGSQPRLPNFSGAPQTPPGFPAGFPGNNPTSTRLGAPGYSLPSWNAQPGLSGAPGNPPALAPYPPRRVPTTGLRSGANP